MSKARFEIYKGRNKQHYFRLVAKNNETILASEGYTSKQGCRNGIASVRKHARANSNFKRAIASNKRLYFNLVASNGRKIGTSQMYKSPQSLNRGIASIKTNARTAEIA